MQMSDYVTACALSDIPVQQALAVQIDGQRLALVRDGDDVYAIADACSHADVALSEGEVSGCTLECWLHGSQFDLRTGKPLTPPAIKPVPVFPTRLRTDDGQSFVEVRTSPLSTDELAAIPTREKEQS
jgi:3-phenylpropionate/trans-cinnamate dioxygenase ferredoxin subunit